MFIPSQTYSFSYDSCRVVDEPMRVVCFRDRCFVSPFVWRVDRCRQNGIADCRYGQHRVGRGGGGAWVKIEGGSAGLDGRKSIVGVRDSAEGWSAKGLGEGGERLRRLGGHRERSRWTVLAAGRGVEGAHARRQSWREKKRRESKSLRRESVGDQSKWLLIRQEQQQPTDQ